MYGSGSGWQREFDEPIVLPSGRKIVTLREAADYITKLPKKESAGERWQTAVGALMLCSRTGDPMFARIGVMQALYPEGEPVFSDRKEHHWGKRKLKRDQ